VASDRQRPESAKEPAIMQRNQAEGDDDQENRFLVNMPTEKEGSVTTKRDCTDKRLPRWLVEQSKKDRLL
jgi:hypothetical protein